MELDLGGGISGTLSELDLGGGSSCTLNGGTLSRELDIGSVSSS